MSPSFTPSVHLKLTRNPLIRAFVCHRFGEHKGSYCVIASFRDGNKENFVDQINVDELEKKSVERNRQASFDLVKSAKRRANMNNLKNQAMSNYLNGSNGMGGMTPNSNGMMMNYTSVNGLFRPNPSSYNGGGVYPSPPATTYYSNNGMSSQRSTTTTNGGHPNSHSRGPFYSPARSTNGGGSHPNNLMNRWTRPDFNVPTIN